ncbi:hypothetical protein FIA58_017505 [Flavobacterium jejuense]|uniref:VanZ-like domain-containing protein n=1 Tax=Flavobacterium jejuense TaxID=1544455 RepID=A0ABX0IU96_9FLAO|nr:VanZ family protein [Flavobacterium jejuense]NHN27479.1 hypothetical protein [Flavobacterium jejuense]
MKITQHLSERKFLYFAFFWSIFIGYICLITIKKTPTLVSIPFKDKIAHFSFYFILFYLWKKALNVKEIKSQLKIVLMAVLYGIIIEVLQGIFTSDRHADIFDALANTLGAVSAFVFLRFVNK